MSTRTPSPSPSPSETRPWTREVLNQPAPLEPVDHYGSYVALQEAVDREGGAWGHDRLHALGAVAGSPEAREHADRADRHEPRLVPYDRYGNRVDAVDLDPSWHWMLRVGVEHEVHALSWKDERPGAHVVRAASMVLYSQIDAGAACPISMTHAVIPALRAGAPEAAAAWEPRLLSADHDAGALAGMAMTERQGGSDVRANTTRAEREPGDGADTYRLWGHKWFCSYPPCDVFLVLAQTAVPAQPGDGDGDGTRDGLSCFLVERGPGMEFQRLKAKLGTHSLPSSEVEFRGIRGTLVGEEGHGVRAIIRMVEQTRLDCLLGSTASIRRGALEAVHHCRQRSAFGARLVDQPAMTNVLADLALESEAATAIALRVAGSFDRGESAFRRFATAVAKYWVCKRAAPHAAEALECLGGNGYVEESGLPRLYRDSPLSGIWEGSGNVMALDVLRAMTKDPEGLPAFLGECELAVGADRRFDAHLAGVRGTVDGLFSPTGEGAVAERLAGAQFGARRLVEDLALTLQGSLLLRHAPAPVADAFCAARLGGEAGRAYGTLPVGVDARAIVDRVLPA